MKYLLNLSTAIQDENEALNVYSSVIGFFDTIEEARKAAKEDLRMEAEGSIADGYYDPEDFDTEEEYEEAVNDYIEDYLSETSYYNNLKEEDFDEGKQTSYPILEHTYVADYWQEAHLYTLIKIA